MYYYIVVVVIAALCTQTLAAKIRRPRPHNVRQVAAEVAADGSPVCPKLYSKCPTDDTCIRTTYFCDGDKDCRDGSDEDKVICADVKCEEGYTKCPFLGKCIKDSYLCDGDDDCRDNSDEDPAFCADRTCPPDRLRCDSGQCVHKTEFCHGEIRCRDGSLTPERANCPANDVIPPNSDPWMMCLIKVQMSCVPPTLNSPEGVGTFFQQFLTHHLSVTCGPLLVMTKCATETLNGCGETALQSMPPMYKKYIDATVDVVDYVCDQHINVFEQYKSCLFGTDEDGSNLDRATETSCPQEIEQLQYLEEMCSSGSQPHLSCIFGVIQNKCGTPIVDRLKELATMIFRGCSADISRSNRKLSVFQRYLQLYRAHY